MESFRENSYDRNKDRRYGLLFLAALLIFLGTATLGLMIHGIAGANSFPEFVLPALPGVIVVLAALAWRAVCHARRNRRLRSKYGSLSRDELLKARSKLKTGLKRVQPPAPSVPDTDLKY